MDYHQNSFWSLLFPARCLEVHVLIPRTYKCCLTDQEGLGRCDDVKDLEKGRSRLIWVSPV